MTNPAWDALVQESIGYLPETVPPEKIHYVDMVKKYRPFSSQPGDEVYFMLVNPSPMEPNFYRWATTHQGFFRGYTDAGKRRMKRLSVQGKVPNARDYLTSARCFDGTYYYYCRPLTDFVMSNKVLAEDVNGNVIPPYTLVHGIHEFFSVIDYDYKTKTWLR